MRSKVSKNHFHIEVENGSETTESFSFIFTKNEPIELILYLKHLNEYYIFSKENPRTLI